MRVLARIREYDKIHCRLSSAAIVCRHYLSARTAVIRGTIPSAREWQLAGDNVIISVKCLTGKNGLQHCAKTPSKYFQQQHFEDNWQRERKTPSPYSSRFSRKRFKNLFLANYCTKIKIYQRFHAFEIMISSLFRYRVKIQRSSSMIISIHTDYPLFIKLAEELLATRRSSEAQTLLTDEIE